MLGQHLSIDTWGLIDQNWKKTPPNITGATSNVCLKLKAGKIPNWDMEL
jgi:hypothetical protein